MKLSFTVLAIIIFNLLSLQLAKAFTSLEISTNSKESNVRDFYLSQNTTSPSQAYISEGTLKLQKGDYQSAIEQFNLAIEADENNFYGYYSRATAYVYQEKYQNAIEDFSRAIEIDPNIAQSYWSRGIVYQMIGNNDLAIVDATKAISIDPNFASAYELRALAYISQGNIQKGKEGLQQAAALYQQQGNTEKYQKMMQFIDKLNGK